MKISVVVCSYNRAKFIYQAIESLVNQSLEKSEYEIILINNNSTDETHEICQRALEEFKDSDMRYFIETNQGLSFARNRGIKESRYDLITYMDDDGVADPSLLQNILNCFKENPSYAGVGGKVIPIYETEEPAWLSYHTRMMVTHIDYGNEKFKCYGKKYPPGCNMTYKKALLESVGGFNEALKWRVDDKYIYYEIRKLDDKIFFIPELEVGHNIDKYRVSDESFDILSKRLGEEEKLRMLSTEGKGAYVLKVIEYFIKSLATFLFYLKFLVKGEAIKGRYLLRMRWLAFKGLVG